MFYKQNARRIHLLSQVMHEIGQQVHPPDEGPYLGDLLDLDFISVNTKGKN